MSRKFVFNEQQLEELIANPSLATAVIMAFKNEPDITVKNAFMLARASLKQFELFKSAVADGSIVVPDTIEKAESNNAILAGIAKSVGNEKAMPKRGVSASV